MNNRAVLEKQHPVRKSTDRYAYGPAALYRLSQPYVYDAARPPCTHVFVSTTYDCAARRLGGEWQTFAFPADEAGRQHSYAELPGSTVDEDEAPSHAVVLRTLGYDVDAPERHSEET